MTTKTDTTTTLTDLIAYCIKAYEDQGYPPGCADLSAGDCEWICDRLGRKPTRDEWADCGYGYVGDAHVAD